MTLTDEALAELAREQAIIDAAAEAERQALRQAATAALKDVLTRADGTTLTLTEVSLAAVDADIAAGRVVWSDKEVSLAAILRDGKWEVFLVGKVDGEWTRKSEPLADLADLGAAL